MVGLEIIMSDEEKKKSYFYIEFEDVGSAKFEVKLENITPIQMLAMAEWMRFEAEYQLQMEKAVQLQQKMQDAQMKKLFVPGQEDWQT